MKKSVNFLKASLHLDRLLLTVTEQIIPSFNDVTFHVMGTYIPFIGKPIPLKPYEISESDIRLISPVNPVDDVLKEEIKQQIVNQILPTKENNYVTTFELIPVNKYIINEIGVAIGIDGLTKMRDSSPNEELKKLIQQVIDGPSDN